MPAQARIGDTGSGHDACGSTTLISGSDDTFVNEIPACRVGDSLGSHGCPAHPTHGRKVSSGSSTVFINTRGSARIGDPIDCGGLIVQGSSDTFFV